MRGFWLFIFLFSLVACKGLQDVERLEKTFSQTYSHHVTLDIPDQLSKSKHGNFLLKVSGSPYEIGYKSGLLLDTMYAQQEQIFFQQIKEMTGSTRKQRFLLQFLKWYHRDILQYIPQEYQVEIFGISRFATTSLDTVASGFQRALMLHGAHDIGHAMQDLMLVGCSSVTAKGMYSLDGSIWMARNFDFYVSDAFAHNKIISFVEPQNGFKYASIGWPGMLGVVSGMNEKGLAVTINAAKSSIPLKAKLPISLVVKEILQYAETIDEAIAIAQQKQVFVSESILVASAADNNSVIIELSPKKMGVFQSDEELLICTNHFQSDIFSQDKRNQHHIRSSHSAYRCHTIQQFFEDKPQVNQYYLTDLLRKTSGIDGRELGYGNEKALNQLMAHHAVIFHPKTRRMWVSNAPYQLGAFDMYDLNEVFYKNNIVPDESQCIPEDPFMYSETFLHIKSYRELLKQVITTINSQEIIPLSVGKQLIAYNPHFWEAHFWAGRIAFVHKQYALAKMYFEQAFQCEITTEQDADLLKKWIEKCQKKIK